MINTRLLYFKKSWNRSLGLSKWQAQVSACPWDSFQVLTGATEPTFSPAPDITARLTSAVAPSCSLDVWPPPPFLASAPLPTVSVCDCHLSRLQNNGPHFPLPPSNSALARL